MPDDDVAARFDAAIARGDTRAFDLAREASRYAAVGEMPVWLIRELDDKDQQLREAALDV